MPQMKKIRYPIAKIVFHRNVISTECPYCDALAEKAEHQFQKCFECENTYEVPQNKPLYGLTMGQTKNNVRAFLQTVLLFVGNLKRSLLLRFRRTAVARVLGVHDILGPEVLRAVERVTGRIHTATQREILRLSAKYPAMEILFLTEIMAQFDGVKNQLNELKKIEATASYSMHVPVDLDLAPYSRPDLEEAERVYRKSLEALKFQLAERMARAAAERSGKVG